MRPPSIPPASMFFRGIGTASPANRYTKAECLEAFQKSDWYARLDARSHLIARTVLKHDNGILARRLAVDSIGDVFRIDPNTLMQRLLAHAPALATKAAEQALAGSGLASRDIGAVTVSTCTGYLCPGLSGYVIERLGLRTDVQAYDVGQGARFVKGNPPTGALGSDCCQPVPASFRRFATRPVARFDYHGFFACEPRRTWLSLAGSHLAGLIGVGAVTRKDAVLSVHAGFRDRELSALWPADPDEWRVQEYSPGLFSHCFHAVRVGKS